MTMLTPVIALVVWTLIVWLWMYATRIPAMQKAKINPQDALERDVMSELPIETRVVADNYNHLHEQPTLFYALAFYSHLAGFDDGLNVALAWGYVGLRVVHSIVQIVVRNITLRFGVFVLASLMLFIIAARNLVALFI